MVKRSALILPSHASLMYRITRGHSVQHIHFPLPVYGRDLDAEEEARPSDAPTAESTTPPAAEDAGEAAS